MKSLIFNRQLYSDLNFLRALHKLTGVKLPSSIRTMEEAIFYHINSIGDINLGDVKDIKVIYEQFKLVAEFCTLAVKDKYKSDLFDTLDATSLDKDVVFLLVDTSFESPNNLFIVANSTKFKQYCVNDSKFVVTATFTHAEESYVKQLISLKSFFHS